MESLLSGLIGALIATLLSLIYHHNSERKKMRADVLLEIVSYCDDIYTLLRQMHVHRDHVYTGKKPALHSDEYRHISRELTVLLLSSKPAAKLALAYGEGKIMGLFNELKSCFLEVSSELRGATRSGWIIENEKVSTLFSKKIDPLRANLEKNLLIESQSIQLLPEHTKNSLNNVKVKIINFSNRVKKSF